MKKEFLVDAGHQPASITSLPFVHTARRYYRLNDLMSLMDQRVCWQQRSRREVMQI
jgi:hypothetical protein